MLETMETTTPQAGGAYEFSAAQNEVIRRAGTRIRWWGAFTGGAGLLMVALGVVAMFSSDPTAIVAGLLYGAIALIPVFVGLHFVRSGTSLTAVVETTGSDMSHLMSAMDSMSRAFLIQLVAAGVWLGLAVLGGIIALSLS